MKRHLRQSNHPKSPLSIPEDSPMTQIHPQAKLGSLEELRGQLSRFILHNDYRDRIIDLYEGFSDEHWFEQEVIECFGDLCEIESGITFLSALHQKMHPPISAWIDTIVHVFNSLAMHESGCNLLLASYSFMSGSDRAMIARYIFSEFPRLPFTSDSFRDLFYECVVANRNDFDVFRSLFDIQWLDRPEFAPLFAAFILGVPTSMYTELADTVLADIEFFCRDPLFVELVRAVVIRGPQNARDRVFRYAIGLKDDELLRSPGMAKLLIIVTENASADQIEQLFVRLAKTCLIHEPNEELFIKLMGVAPLRTKAAFIIQHVEALTRLGTDRIKMEVNLFESELALRRGG
jgi:hypothetical protein